MDLMSMEQLEALLVSKPGLTLEQKVAILWAWYLESHPEVP